MKHLLLHKSVTVDRVMEAVAEASSSTANPGFCAACGEDAEGCEPDMRRGTCESCGAHQVYGAEELLIMIA